MKLNINNIAIICIVVLTTSSCVTKKSYLEMQNGRYRAEKRVIDLNKETADLNAKIIRLATEFNNIQFQLKVSNAEKDKTIDSIHSSLLKNTSMITEKSEDLDLRLFSLQSEKRQLKSKITNLTEKNSTLEREIAQLNSKMESLNGSIIDAKYNLNNSKDEVAGYTRQIKSLNKKIEQLGEDNSKLESSIESLNEEMATKDAEITKLKNNVKLLKGN